MIKRTFIFFCVCILFPLLGYAQDDVIEPSAKKSVLVDYFTGCENFDSKLADIFRSHVMSSFQNKVILIDIVAEKKAQDLELLRRESGVVGIGDDNNMERMKAISTLGAEYVLSGRVADVVIQLKDTTVKIKKKDSDGKIIYDHVKIFGVSVPTPVMKDSTYSYYECCIPYELNMTNVSDGTMLATTSATVTGKGDTEKDAYKDAYTAIGNYIAGEFADECFPVVGTILEISSEKKGKAKEVYVNVGSKNGVTTSTLFKVYKRREVAGRVAFTRIGWLDVIAVEGPDLSRCKVDKDGADLILQAVRNAETIKIESY